MKDSCKKKDCRYWRDTPLGDSHAKCMTCCHSAWLPKSEKDNYKPNAGAHRQLVNHLDFFRRVLDGTMKLANDQDADCFASWKVGGQDFYVYGTEQNAKGDSQNPGEKL